MITPEFDDDQTVMAAIVRARVIEEFIAEKIRAHNGDVEMDPFVLYETRAEREEYGKIQGDLRVWTSDDFWRVEVKERGGLGAAGFIFSNDPRSFPHHPVHLSPVSPWVKKAYTPDAVLLVSISGRKLLGVLSVNLRRTPTFERRGRDGRTFVCVNKWDLRSFRAFMKVVTS